MLDPGKVKAFELLIASGRTIRGAARVVGISRGSGQIIASGKRKVYSVVESVPKDEPFSGPYARCSTCGGMVQMPCYGCALRKKRGE